MQCQYFVSHESFFRHIGEDALWVYVSLAVVTQNCLYFGPIGFLYSHSSTSAPKSVAPKDVQIPLKFLCDMLNKASVTLIKGVS